VAALIADRLARPVAEIGSLRAPYQPITLGSLADLASRDGGRRDGS
jgi:hypothetical protein